MPAARSSRRGGGGRTSASKSDTGESLSSLAEQLVTRMLGPLDAVLLTRQRIRETLDEAAEHGRLTRSDANDLAVELIRRGRLQTQDLLAEVDRLVTRSRDQ